MFTKSDMKKLIFPLIIEQTLALTVGMIDIMMVSSAGESAVSGVSLVETINVLLINLFAALATGGAVVAGQYLGKEDPGQAGHAARQLLVATFSLSLIIMAVALIFNRPILSLIFGSIEADVMTQARTYFYLTALSYPFIAVFNASASLFRSMGNSKVPMINAFIMNLINIIGNAILIFGMGWGVFGAALATLISRIIATITMLVMLRNPKNVLSVRSYSLRDTDFRMIRRILGLGIPNGLENSMFQIGKIVVTSLIAYHGTGAIAANAVANSLSGIEIIPGYALGLAMITIVSRCVGRSDYESAHQNIKYLLKLAYIYMIVLNVAMLLLLWPLLHLYQLSDEAFRIALQLMLLHTLCAMAIWPLSFTLPNAFRAAGDVRYPMIISIISMWTFRIGLSCFFVFVLHLGAISVWIAMVIDWSFRSICFVQHWLRGKWKRHTVI